MKGSRVVGKRICMCSCCAVVVVVVTAVGLGLLFSDRDRVVTFRLVDALDDNQKLRVTGGPESVRLAGWLARWITGVLLVIAVGAELGREGSTAGLYARLASRLLGGLWPARLSMFAV